MDCTIILFVVVVVIELVAPVRPLFIASNCA